MYYHDLAQSAKTVTIALKPVTIALKTMKFRIGQGLVSEEYMYYSRSEFGGVHVLPKIRIH